MKQLLIIVSVMFGAATLQGCEALRGPLKAADTAETAQQRSELRAWALEREYNIILEDALVVASAPTTNANVQAAIQRASASGTAVIDSLSDAAAAFAVERAKLEAGQSTVEKVTVAVNNLDSWITKGSAALLALQAAFR